MLRACLVSSYVSGPGSDKETRIKSTKRERVKIVKGLTSRRNSPWVSRGPGSDKETQTMARGSTIGWQDLKNFIGVNASILIVADFGRYSKILSNLGKDVVAPYKHVVESYLKDDPPNTYKLRKTLLFFRGRTVRKSEGKVRRKLEKLLKGYEDVHFEAGFATDDGINAGMRSSKFCLHPAGDTPSYNRLFDAIVNHCIPAIVSYHIELPFESELDDSKFALFFSVKEALIPGYMYHPKKDDAVNMIWRKVRTKVPAERLAVVLRMFDRENSGLELGPGFLETSSQGILLEAESNIRTTTLEFIMGDAGDSCAGDFMMVALVESLKWNFLMRSNSVRSRKKYSLNFQFNKTYITNNVVRVSFVSYKETRTYSDSDTVASPSPRAEGPERAESKAEVTFRSMGLEPSYKTWDSHGEPNLPPPVIDNTTQPQMSDMTACLNDLSYIPPNNEQNEPTQGDIGETSNGPRLKLNVTSSMELYASATWKDSNTPGKKVPKKVLRYFPIIPRLQRLYKSSHTAKEMTWHATGKCTEPGKMQHPVDGRAWKDFDTKYLDFAAEPRNVRLGLAADGFNPFGNLSQSYNMWPVILTTYNLPPWLCMKESSFMLTLLIPGPKSPGKDIDGLKFNMRAMVLWTINDFPARSSLSGWSGQGYKACPTCNEDTSSVRVLGKTAYVGHKRFLKKPHKWRRSLKFNGETETENHP
ncbi:hypothetical protein Tco_0678274 [Tanacetum coccineum]|uniref:Exostosin GT47 domain-containing protein n=1 Tax=Tanacetum coccineum TaxID=301880 RepID=A0ABQ4XF74_9ASTR